MRTVFTVPLLLAIAACAGPRYAERSAPVPLLPPQAPVRHEPLPLPDDAATRAWLDREIERNRARSAPPPAEVRQEPAPQPGPDDAATRAWLDQEIERNRYVPPPPPVEVVERIVERPVYVHDSGGYYGSYYYDPYSYRPYYDYGAYGDRSYRHTTFPVHTALGAGIGAIIGNQSGHRGRGAWIGGGLGLLMDLGSRW